MLAQIADEGGSIGTGRLDRDHVDLAEGPQPVQQLRVAGSRGREARRGEQSAALVQRRGVMSVGVRVHPADDERVLLLHAVPAVLSIREGGPVGKGGQNSDEALVASRFLSGHAPPDPTTQMGDQRRPAQSRQVPTNDTERVSLCAGQTPGRTPDLIFTVCATPSPGSSIVDLSCCCSSWLLH
jgi:hypothetical protein